MAGPNKWMGPMNAKIAKAGTKGKLRAAAQKMGILSGANDTLTAADCDRIMASAKKSGNTKLFHEALAAKNMINSHKGKK
jgi:hypothetical protein